MTPESFVPADVAAKFLGINRRFLLDLARMGILGAYPLGTGQLRRRWVFRLTEISEAVGRKHAPTSPPQDLRNDVRLKPGSPR
jgi:hypothetical protein